MAGWWVLGAGLQHCRRRHRRCSLVSQLPPCSPSCFHLTLHLLLPADIVAFQETKLRRCDVDRELAVVEGW